LPDAAGALDAPAAADVAGVVDAVPEQAAAAIATVAVKPRMRTSFMCSSMREPL